MAIGEITNPYEFFTNADGTPLEAGQIYIGVDGLDPQDNPQAAYFDLAGTIGATQPIRTLGGYPVNAGSATKIFTDGSFSVKVLDENNNLVYSDLSVSQIEDNIDALTDRVDAMSVPFDTVADLLADTRTIGDLHNRYGATTGTRYVRVKEGDYQYSLDLAQVGSGGGYVQNDGGVNFLAMAASNGRKQINALGPANDGTSNDAAIFASAMAVGGAWEVDGDYYLATTQECTTDFQLYGDATIYHDKNAGALRLAPSLGTSQAVSSIGANVQYPAYTNNLATPLTLSSTAGLSRGQVCILSSSDVYGYGNGVKKSEIVRILEIVGSTVYTHGVIEDTYSTSIKLTPLSDAKIVVDGPTFSVNEDVYSASTPYGYRGSLELVGCVGAEINVTAKNGTGPAIALFSCWKSDVKATVADLRDKSASNALGYGVVAYGATKYSQITVFAERVRHAYTDGDYGGLTLAYEGVPRFNTVRGVAISCTAAAWDTHPEGHDTLFDGCEAYAGNGDADSTGDLKYGFQLRGRNVTLVSPRVRGSSALYIDQDTDWGKSSECSIVSPDFAIEDGTSQTPFAITSHAQTEDRTVRFSGGSFEGSPNFSNNCPDVEIIGTVQRGATAFRIGQGNKATLLNFSRISDGNLTEGVVVDAGSSLWIDNHFIKTGPSGFIGSGTVIRTGGAVGTATVYLGKITEAAAVGGSVTWVSEQTTTLSLQPLPSVMTALAVGDVQSPAVSGVVRVSTRYEVGASGQGQTNSFTTTDGKTITVTGGIITGVA